MTTEILVLSLTVLLGFGHLLVLSLIQTSIYGLGPLVGPRDHLPASDNVLLGRARRANENFKETLPWALALLVAVPIADAAGPLTAAGGWVYVTARAAYLPLYLLGVPWLRTLAWFLSLTGLAMLLSAILA